MDAKPVPGLVVSSGGSHGADKREVHEVALNQPGGLDVIIKYGPGHTRPVIDLGCADRRRALEGREAHRAL